jgi:hypothetical protein
MKIIDVHYLIGEDYWLKNNKPELEHVGTMDECKKFKLNSNSTNFKSMIYPFPSCFDQKYKEENKKLYDIAKADSNAIPVFALNTNFEECFDYVEKMIKEFKQAGIVIWPILCKINLNELQQNKRFIRFCNENNFFIYIHVGAQNEDKIGRLDTLGIYGPMDAVNLAKSFPNKKFIIGHLLRLSTNAYKELSSLNNAILDTSGLSSHNLWFENNQNVFASPDANELAEMNSKEVLTTLVEKYKLGKKLAFGSSYPFSMWWKYNFEKEVNLILDADIDQNIKDDILYNNVYNFLFNSEEEMRENYD